MFKYILIVIVGIMLYLDANKSKQIDNELKKYKSAVNGNIKYRVFRH